MRPAAGRWRCSRGLGSHGSWASIRDATAPSPVSVTGAVAAELAALAALAVDEAPDDAEALFRRAAELWSGNWLAGELRCGVAAADSARLAGRSDDAEAALIVLQGRAAAAGMVAFLARIEASRRKLGASPRARPAVVPGRSGPGDGLTRREREILRLVGAGLSSRDIAQLLSIAQSTVETQIRSAMRKLGAATRIQAATLVWFRTEDALLNENDPERTQESS